MGFGILLAAAIASPIPAPAILGCDKLASHPDDPDRAAPGLEREEMDLPAAEQACRAAVAYAPESARSNYNLGRSVFYQGRQREALPFLETAAAMGYRQAIFVVGYAHTLGGDIPKDICRSQQLYRQGVALEHPWAAFHLVDNQIRGAFAGCPQPISKSEVARALDIALSGITIKASAGRLEALKLRADVFLSDSKKD